MFANVLLSASRQFRVSVLQNIFILRLKSADGVSVYGANKRGYASSGIAGNTLLVGPAGGRGLGERGNCGGGTCAVAYNVVNTQKPGTRMCGTDARRRVKGGWIFRIPSVLVAWTRGK